MEDRSAAQPAAHEIALPTRRSATSILRPRGSSLQSCLGHGSPNSSKNICEPQLHSKQNTALSQYRQRVGQVHVPHSGPWLGTPGSGLPLGAPATARSLPRGEPSRLSARYYRGDTRRSPP